MQDSPAHISTAADPGHLLSDARRVKSVGEPAVALDKTGVRYYGWTEPHRLSWNEVLTEWWHQVGQYHRDQVGAGEVMAPAPGVTWNGVELCEAVAGLRRDVRDEPKGSQSDFMRRGRQHPWWDWVSGEAWRWFDERDPATAPSHLLIEAHWGWENLTNDGALIVAPADAPMWTLVRPLLEALGDWEEDHWWHFQITPERKTAKRQWWPENRGAHVPNPEQEDEPAAQHRWAYDCDTPLGRLVGHRDQMYWVFDYGDTTVLRLQVLDPDRKHRATLAADRLVDGHGWGETTRLLRPMLTQCHQYPDYVDEG